MLSKSEHVLLRLQRVQQMHDELAHRDILSFDLYKKLKHMVLHFYKYAGRIEQAKSSGDFAELERTLIDTFIICMASANAMNISLGAAINLKADKLTTVTEILAKDLADQDIYSVAVRELVLLGGQMAKAVESSDHMERGDPRLQMESLVPKLAAVILGCLGVQKVDVDSAVRARLSAIEAKSIFRSLESHY